MTDDEAAGYAALTFLFLAGTIPWAISRAAAVKPVWPALVPVAIWLAPVALRVWFAVVL